MIYFELFSWAAGSFECICWREVLLNVWGWLGLFEGSLISVRHLPSPTDMDWKKYLPPLPPQYHPHHILQPLIVIYARVLEVEKY